MIVLLAALGISLSIGLTASSIAIMGSAPEEKAGAATALEATRYDLGTGLGITGFGLVLASSYRNAIELPGGLPAGMAAKATESIGETLVAAQALEGGGRGLPEPLPMLSIAAARSTRKRLVPAEAPKLA